MAYHTHLSLISELTFRVPEGNMESIYTELAFYGNKNLCAKTDNVFSLISEVCDGTVSLL